MIGKRGTMKELASTGCMSPASQYPIALCETGGRFLRIISLHVSVVDEGFSISSIHHLQPAIGGWSPRPRPVAGE